VLLRPDPQESPSSLPNLDLGARAAFRLGLGLPQIGEAELRALGDNWVILRFDHVTAQTVLQGELRQAINRQACPEVARLIDKDPEALKQSDFLLGEVFRARSIVRVNRERGGGGLFSLKGLRALAARLGLRLRAEAAGDLEGAQVVELSNPEPLPVAFRPAFIRLDPTQPGATAPLRDGRTRRPLCRSTQPPRTIAWPWARGSTGTSRQPWLEHTEALSSQPPAPCRPACPFQFAPPPAPARTPPQARNTRQIVPPCGNRTGTRNGHSYSNAVLPGPGREGRRQVQADDTARHQIRPHISREG
jgi:hypothetical protein